MEYIVIRMAATMTAVATKQIVLVDIFGRELQLLDSWIEGKVLDFFRLAVLHCYAISFRLEGMIVILASVTLGL